MIKLLASLIVFSIAAIATLNMRSRTAEVSALTAETSRRTATMREQISRMETERLDLRESIRQADRTAEFGQSAEASSSEDFLLNKTELSPEEAERLRAELGFSWHTTGDYLIVSKPTLKLISVQGVNKNKLTKTAKDLLAITPEEQRAIEGVMAEIVETYAASTKSRLKREEPQGDTVLNYHLPSDPELSLSLSNRFCSALLSALGEQRSDLLRNYASDWMNDLSLIGGMGTTLILKRPNSANTEQFQVEIKQGAGTIGTDLNLWTQFPESFRCLFPGGWVELLQREGLPVPETLSTRQ